MAVVWLWYTFDNCLLLVKATLGAEGTVPFQSGKVKGNKVAQRPAKRACEAVQPARPNRTCSQPRKQTGSQHEGISRSLQDPQVAAGFWKIS